MTLLEEFKKFILKGNVLDLAVAVMIGAAFNKIVSSLVEDIFTPILGFILGGINFTGQVFSIGDAVIKYGKFIQTVIDFLLMAIVIFILLKVYGKMVYLAKLKLTKKEREEEKREKAADAKEIELLKEIRDLLKKK